MTSESPINVLFLCTGNAARSVMATIIAQALVGDQMSIWGGGTHSIEGLPMSTRTRAALRGLSLEDFSHRSHQLTATDTTKADVIVGFETGNVEYVRRTHPDAAWKTATIRRLVDHLPAPEHDLESLEVRLRPLELERAQLAPNEEVIDPAGGDQAVFDACVAEVDGLVRALLPVLVGSRLSM